MSSKEIQSKMVALIPARYQSSRLPGKPLLKIGDKTIIERTYRQTLKSKYLNQGSIYVVSDDDRIINHVREFGGIALKMDQECLNGTERICKVLNCIEPECQIIINVQGDEPFIDPNNLDLAIEKYLENQDDSQMVCTTIHSKITNNLDLHNRGIGKMVLDKHDNVLYCSRAMIPHSKDAESHSGIDYFAHIGIFIFRRSYLPLYLEHPDTPAQLCEDIEWLKILEMGYRIKSYCVESSEIGINTQEDFNYLSKKHQS